MKKTAKIRWLLLIVTIGLFVISLASRWVSTHSFDLEKSAKKISIELAKKEILVNDYLNNPKQYSKLKNIEKDAESALKKIAYFSSNGIYFQVYKNNKLVLWSDNRLGQTYAENLKNGTSFISTTNSWYQTIKKGDSTFFAVFYILIKSNYSNQNQFLSPNYSSDLIKDQSITIADASDKNVKPIRGLNGNYLFSIKESSVSQKISYSKFEIALWIVGFLTLIIFINSFFKYYADRGRIVISFIGLTLTLCLLRIFGQYYKFPDAVYTLEIFSSPLNTSYSLLPTLGDLGLDIFLFLWVLLFIYSYKYSLFKPIRSYYLGVLLIVVSAIFISFISFGFSDLFFELVYNSNINFRVTNLVNFNGWSVLGLVILLTTILAYYLILELVVYFSLYIKIPLKEKIAILIILLGVFTLYKVFFSAYLATYFLVFLLIFVIGWVVYKQESRVHLNILILIVLIFAIIVSIKLNNFEKIKEFEFRKSLALKLAVPDDSNEIVLLSEFENKLFADSIYFFDLENAEKRINFLLRKDYSTSVLGKYRFKVIAFDELGASLNHNYGDSLRNYKKQVDFASIKVSNNFYRVNNSFGLNNYFCIIPVKYSKKHVGTIVIELNSKEIRGFGSFPQVLKDGKLTFIEDYVGYSYAYYFSGELVYQSGNYIYDLVNRYFIGNLKESIVKRKEDYSHLIYQPTLEETIVISKEIDTFWIEIAFLSFFFLIFLTFGIIIISNKWIWKVLTSYRFNFRNFKVGFYRILKKIRYKTRIQVVLLFAVVSCLIIIGLITFSYVKIQYKNQQESLVKERINILAAAFNDKAQTANSLNNKKFKKEFFRFSKIYNTDLNMFDKHGVLLYSTQDNIFNTGALAGRMDPKAFVYMDIVQKSEYIQEEFLGELEYLSAYVPILNADKSILGYLQLPYFSNKNEFNEKVGNFLNLLLNIYVLVFVAIGFFAVIVANQITSPLTMIQNSISKIEIGRKNRPISWKREDEIGQLIREYNNMIFALDESANKFAQSEREIAWREMARQVAHEIKNPLTPLRLGIQMLERSWKDKDHDFELKFEKFNKSFIEQIDSLNKIANDFSDFAKMPDLNLENLEIVEVLNEVIKDYKKNKQVHIICNDIVLNGVYVKADRDQLLRSFGNLFKNAVEAMKADKEGLIVINCSVFENNIEIKIQDNGVGIPVDMRKRIFMPNFTTKSSGTGLSLAFVKQAIEKIGGSIYFTTRINVGTSFYITLPRVK